MHRTVNVVAAAFAAVAALAGPLAAVHAQTLTVTTGKDSRFEIIVPPGYKVDPDKTNGVVRVQARLIFHWVRVPRPRYRVQKQRPLLPGAGAGITGDLLAFPARWVGKTPKDLIPPGEDYLPKVDGILNDDLYNAVRKYISSPELAQTLVGGPGDEAPPRAAGQPEPPVRDLKLKTVMDADPKRRFVFGDQHDNGEAARIVAFQGASRIEFPLDDPRLRDVALLDDPDQVGSGRATTQALTQTNLERYGRWYFDKVMVLDTRNPKLGPLPMVEVRTEWAVVADLEPGKKVEFPIVSAQIDDVTLPDKEASAGPAAKDEKAGQNAAPATIPGFLLGNDVAALLAGGTTPASRPGLNFVTGVSVQNDGTPALIGVLLSGVDADGKPRAARILGQEIKGVGLMAGKTTGDRGGYVLGPTIRLNPSAALYAGGAFRETSGSTRFGFSAGVLLSLSELIAPRSSAAGAQTPRIKVVTVGSSVFSPPSYEDFTAAVVWVVKTSGAADKPVPPFTTIVDYPNGDKGQQFPTGITPGSSQTFWITYLKPCVLKKIYLSGQSAPLMVTMPSSDPLQAGRHYQATIDVTANTVTVAPIADAF